jgi:hypothetical protein
MAYRDADIILVDPYNPWPVDSPNPPLQRYLNLIGFQLDFIRTELESLMSINDAQNCSGALLPLMAQQLGLVHEPEVGMQQERQLIENAIHLYKNKGSPRGITEMVSILTSYPATQLVHHGYNCLLCLDDGVMADAIGTWQVWPPQIPNAYTNRDSVNGTVTRAPIFPALPGQATGIALTWIPNLTGPPSNTTNPLETYPSNWPSIQPQYNNTGMRIQATGAGDLNVTTGGVPITDFMSQNGAQGHITWRVQVWSAVSRTVWLSVWGDVGSGTRVQVLPEQSFTETAGHWTEMTITGTINPYPTPPPGPGAGGPSGPASYYKLYPQIRVAGAAANEPHYVTICGLWPCTPAQIGVDTPVYDYPRDVKILLQPQSSNLLSNPVSTFSRLNPNAPPPTVGIGFDGLTNAVNPNAPTVAPTCGLAIRYANIEDPPALAPVNGTGALQITTTGPGATVWWGKVTNWSAPPASPNGWFASPRSTPPPAYTDGHTNDWFFNAVAGTLPRNWMDPVYGWFTMDQSYFGVGSAYVNGVWYALPPQPAMNGNLSAFNVTAGQPFNFSVYAQYITVQDPSNAQMLLGLRWYYPDGTYTESTYPVMLTDGYQRYSMPNPSDPTSFYLGEPPPEQNPPTGALPTLVYPFVRFPLAQNAQFLVNSAMLSPSLSLDPYMDATSYSSASGDFITDAGNASFIYRRRTPRVARLNEQLYRWLPMGSTYTITYASPAITPPLDPTLWP